MSTLLESLTLTRRLIITVAVIVFLTALIANLAAYRLIKTELAALVDSSSPLVMAAEQRLLTALLVNTLIIAVIGALFSGYFMRRLVSPVWRLSKAAKRMAHGDLKTPIQVNTHTLDITTLANALEQSRNHLSKTMLDLAQTRDWLQALVQSITEGIVRFNREGQITFFNEGAAVITGWEAKDAIDQPLDKILHLMERQDLSFLDQLPPLGERRSLVISTRGGQPCHITVTRAHPIGDGQTTIVLHDITEEAQRRNLQAYFLAHMSHEFRTPLSALRISIELLQDNWRYLSFSEMDELLTSIYLSTTTLQNLIDNLLESSKIEANYLELRRRPSHLNTILADALRTIQPLLNRREQSLSLLQPLTLPAIDGDPVRLVQVIVNIVSNASKYSPAKTRIDILIQYQHDTDDIRISVADQGQGIPADQQENVFRRFIRLNGEEQNSSEYGSGLGLSVVKAIVEGHGGKVGIEAREAGGSVFWFTLPVVKELHG